MPFEDIGIGIRAKIQGTEEGERLAQTFQKIKASAADVGTQRPGFDKWKQELQALDRGVDQWHAKILKMELPFSKQDVEQIEKYARTARVTLRGLEEEQRRAFDERIARLQEEQKLSSVLMHDKIQHEIELTQKEQERWQKETGFYEDVIGETERSLDRAQAASREQAARGGAKGGVGAGVGRAVRWGAGIAAAGLAIGGGIGLMEILGRAPEMWTEWETEQMRWRQRMPGLEEAAGGVIGLGYRQNRALGLAQQWAEQAGTFQGAQGAYGFARAFGVQPEEVQGFAMIQRLSGANIEKLLRQIAGATEATGRSLALLPEQIRTIEEWAGVMTRYTSRISEQGMVGLPAMVAAMGPEYTGGRIMDVLAALQQGMTEPGSQGVRAFMLRAMGLGQPGMNYYLATRRLEAGLAGIPAEEIRQMYEMKAIGPEAYERFKTTGITGYMNLRDVLEEARRNFGAMGAFPLMAMTGAFPELKGWQAEDIWKQFTGGQFTEEKLRELTRPAAERIPAGAVSLPEQRIVEIEQAARQVGEVMMPFITAAQKALARGVTKIFDGLDEVFTDEGRKKIIAGIKEMWESKELRLAGGGLAFAGGILSGPLGYPAAAAGAGTVLYTLYQDMPKKIKDEVEDAITGKSKLGTVTGLIVPPLGGFQNLSWIFNKIMDAYDVFAKKRHEEQVDEIRQLKEAMMATTEAMRERRERYLAATGADSSSVRPTKR